jgi:hypothetical protein
MSEPIVCTPKSLPAEDCWLAALRAIDENPVNRPRVERLFQVPGFDDIVIQPDHLAVLTTKYWRSGGVKLTVGFMESIQPDLRDRILAHANKWSAFANISFVYSQTSPQVRVTRSGGGYWSYLGVDVLSIPPGQPTMSLQDFSMSLPESEFNRVVPHEFGHTCGFPHEHMRRELVSRIDAEKAIAYFMATQGWSRQMVIQQVLTPLEEGSLLGTDHADETSIMAYQLPASITKDGRPILGGADIDAEDQAFAGKVYPRVAPPTPPPATKRLTIEFTGDFKIVA